MRNLKPGRSRAIAFAVTDTGIAFPRKNSTDHPRSFSNRADGAHPAKLAAPGLGFSISREIARLLGGSPAVELQAAAGDRHAFALYLPKRGYAGHMFKAVKSRRQEKLPLRPKPRP